MLIIQINLGTLISILKKCFGLFTGIDLALNVLVLNNFFGGIEPSKNIIKPVIVCHEKHKIYLQNSLLL